MSASQPLVLAPLALARLLGSAPNEGAPFRLEVSAGDRRPTRASPVVEGKLSGVSASFVLDTGAGAHALASWLVKKARLETREADVKLREAGGRSLDAKIVSRVELAVAGLGTFKPENAIVAEFPPFFEDEAIGGALSPQLLPSGGRALVLDMPGGQARIQDATSARRAAGALRYSLAQRGIEGCSELAAPVPNLRFGIPTLIDGQELLLTLDTGAGRTAIHEASSVPGVVVKAGAAEATLEVDLVPAKSNRMCGTDGRLGMDVLRRCLLAVSPTDFAGSCNP